MKNETINNAVTVAIANRRSVREYKHKAILKEHMATILEAALLAPTGRNAQSCHVIMVTNRAILNELVEGFHEHAKIHRPTLAPGFDPIYNAPAFAFVIGDTNNRWHNIDGGIIVQNMVLAAESLGIGTCIVGMVADFMNSPEGAGIMAKIGAPADHEFVIGMAMGYKNENPKPRPRDASKVRIIE